VFESLAEARPQRRAGDEVRPRRGHVEFGFEQIHQAQAGIGVDGFMEGS
jgi:hypothetical protein